MKNNPKDLIAHLFYESGRELSNFRRLIRRFEVRPVEDIHAYYDLILGNQILQVSGFPEKSNEQEMNISARVLDGEIFDNMQREKIPTGKEDEAVVKSFRYMQNGLFLPYSKTALTGVLSSCIYETYLGNMIEHVNKIAPYAQRIVEIMREENGK
jgi:hypothetical protein